MAESRRKADAKKSAKAVTSDEEKALQTRFERITLLLYLEGAVAIVVGMIVLSEFLSQGEPSRPVLIAAGILFGILLVGIGATVLARRRVFAPKA